MEAEQLTDHDHGTSSLNLSPDESRSLLAFSDDDPLQAGVAGHRIDAYRVVRNLVVVKDGK